MYYNILDFDSSNIKVLNDIESISGIIKIDGKDVIQDSSNYIKNIKERIITQDSESNDVIISDIYLEHQIFHLVLLKLIIILLPWMRMV